jgi:hypothetical protein
MRKLVLIALAAVAAPTVSSAQLQLGARLGYAIAGGDAAKDEKMSDGVKSQVPLQVDAAWRFTKELAVGAYFSYGDERLGQGRNNVKAYLKEKPALADSILAEVLTAVGIAVPQNIDEMTADKDKNPAAMPEEATLVLNTSNSLIKKLEGMCSDTPSDVAKAIAKQIYTLALVGQRQLTADELSEFLNNSFNLLERI